jgi:hypothetical protein
VQVPAGLFSAGDYILTVSGISRAEASDVVAEYAFGVSKK